MSSLRDTLFFVKLIFHNSIIFWTSNSKLFSHFSHQLTIATRFRKCDYFNDDFSWMFDCFFSRFFVLSELTKTKSLLLLIVLWTLECWWKICSCWSIRWATDARTNWRWFIRLHRKVVVSDDFTAIGIVVTFRQSRRKFIEDEVTILRTARSVHCWVLFKWRAIAL